MSGADKVVDAMLEAFSDSPFRKPVFTLEYRPYLHGEDQWQWFWVLLPDDNSKAVAHGTAKNRHLAGIEARLKAREQGGVVGKVTIVSPRDSLEPEVREQEVPVDAHDNAPVGPADFRSRGNRDLRSSASF